MAGFFSGECRILLITKINFYLSLQLRKWKQSVIIRVLWRFAIMGCSNPCSKRLEAKSGAPMACFFVSEPER